MRCATGITGRGAAQSLGVRERTLIAAEGSTEQVDIDTCTPVAQPGPDRRSPAAEARSAQRLHRAGEIIRVNEKIDVLREPLVAVLDHGEASGDGKRDLGVAQNAAGTDQRLVNGSDGYLAHPRGLQELTVGTECGGAHELTLRGPYINAARFIDTDAASYSCPSGRRHESRSCGGNRTGARFCDEDAVTEAV